MSIYVQGAGLTAYQKKGRLSLCKYQKNTKTDLSVRFSNYEKLSVQFRQRFTFMIRSRHSNTQPHSHK